MKALNFIGCVSLGRAPRAQLHYKNVKTIDLFHENPPAMSRSPQIKVARWPKSD